MTKLMMMTAIVFMWSGVLVGTSFLATPLKFKAPNITLSLAVGIGQVVFHAMNKLEWVFELALLVLMALVFKKEAYFLRLISLGFLLSIFLAILLSTQTILLHYLDFRVEKIIKGETLPPSKLHFSYIVLEIVKFATLLAKGAWLLFSLKTRGL